MEEGFAELTAEAGVSEPLSFGGVALAGILNSSAGTEQMKVDTKLGANSLLFLEVARSELAKLAKPPRIGESFSLGLGKLRILEIDDEDVSSVSVVYTVKRS